MPDLGELPLDRFCNLIWYWATRNAESQVAVSKFENALWMPLPGQIGQGPWSAEAENSAFRSLKSSMQ